MPKRKQIVPGSIFVRKGTNKLTIKYRGKQYPTGRVDSVVGRKVAQDILERMHNDYVNFRQLPPAKSKGIFEVFETFLTTHCSGLEIATKSIYKHSFRAITPKNYYASTERINNNVVEFITNNKNLSQSSITIYLRHYSVFANYCLKNGIIDEYPDKLRTERKSSKRAEKKKEIVLFDKQEIDLLVAYFDKRDREFALLLLFMWYTGARIGESLTLTWEQIDFKLRRIRFSNKVNKSNDDYIPISSVVEKILTELKRKNSNKVFRWKAVSHSSLHTKFYRAMKKVGIEKQGRGFHAIRRTFATNLIDSNISLVDVKDLMRHKDIKTTLEHYKAKKSQRLESIIEKSIIQSDTAPNLHLLNRTIPTNTA